MSRPAGVLGVGDDRRGLRSVSTTTGAGWAAAIALSRVPPCQVLLRTKSCSTFTLVTVTLRSGITVSFRLAMIRYWPAGSASS